MDRKYVIEITAEGITKTFTDKDGKEYIEKWERTETGSRTTGACITAQLDQYGDYEETELLDAIDQDDLDALWQCFEER